MSKVVRTRFVLAVPDLARSSAFYRETLGFEVEFEVDGWCFLKREQCRLMLGECPDATPAEELGDHSYFAYLEVEGIDELFERVRSHDGDILSPPTDQPWGMREFGLRTIDGHRMMFGQDLSS